MRRWIAANLAVLGLLAVLTAAGGALRVEPAANPSRYQSVDERAYARLARNLARHGTYDAPEMADPVRWPPGAPVVFAAAHKVRPRADRGRAAGTCRPPIRCSRLFSTATIPATFAARVRARRARSSGLAAAGAIAFYPPLIGRRRATC